MPGSSPGMTSEFACTSISIFKQPPCAVTTPRSRRAFRASFAEHIALSNQRAQGMPGARCARSLVCELRKHTSVVTTVTPGSPGIPRAMVLTASFALSPVSRACLPPSSPRSLLLKNLTPASGRQDHTTSPSTSAPFVKGAARVHRIPHSTSVTIAIRPSVRQDGRACRDDLPDTKSEIFFAKGLDDPNHVDPAR
jgi:hypothetical protein